MSDESERLHIDLERMFPAAARRVRILEELRRAWPSVVGVAIARHSVPSVLGVNAITVRADSSQAAMMLSRMKGNILRALSSRFGYESSGEFTLRIQV